MKPGTHARPMAARYSDSAYRPRGRAAGDELHVRVRHGVPEAAPLPEAAVRAHCRIIRVCAAATTRRQRIDRSTRSTLS
jgi:hypothetical protein